MRVEVDDRHALTTRAELASRDRDVVEEAEAHRLGRTRVMTRRPDGQEGPVGTPCAQGVDRGETGPRRHERRRPRTHRRGGVGPRGIGTGDRARAAEFGPSGDGPAGNGVGVDELVMRLPTAEQEGVTP